VPIAPEAIQPDGRAEVNGYLLEFIVDQALIEVHLAFLESLPDGKSLAAQLREQNLDFLVFGRPAEGGRTGC
jgi:hypothetical protein